MGLAPNPMPAIWRNVSSQIARLERSSATKSEWASSASSSDAVTSHENLTLILGRSRLVEADQMETNKLFKSVDEVMHFGFDDDFHALVFFIRGRPVAVKKW